MNFRDLSQFTNWYLSFYFSLFLLSLVLFLYQKQEEHEKISCSCAIKYSTAEKYIIHANHANTWHFNWSSFHGLCLCAKFHVCSTLPCGRFGMVGDHHLNCWWPSWGWWLTIHDISPGLNFLSQVYVPNSKPVVHFPLVDLGWWVTILWMVGGHPGDGGRPSAHHLFLGSMLPQYMAFSVSFVCQKKN